MIDIVEICIFSNIGTHQYRSALSRRIPPPEVARVQMIAITGTAHCELVIRSLKPPGEWRGGGESTAQCRSERQVPERTPVWFTAMLINNFLGIRKSGHDQDFTGVQTGNRAPVSGLKYRDPKEYNECSGP